MAYSVNGFPTGQTAGTMAQRNSRFFSILESELTHPSHSDGFADDGDPVIWGKLVGVAQKDAAAATDFITVDTKGVHNLTVSGTNDAGNVAVEKGDALYINTSDGVISKVESTNTNIPFGIAGGTVVSAAETVIAVILGGVAAGQSGSVAFADDEPLYFGDDNDRTMVFDGSNFSITSTGVASDWSHNLVSVTATAGAGEGTRGWRVNMTTAASATMGDMQCVHGYLTMGATPTLGAGAAIYPISAWLDLPDTTTTSTGNVICGVRSIVDANNNDLSGMAGGGESALFYGQTWASSGAIEHGLRIIAGAGTTIKNAISIGGSGTFSQMFDFTEGQSGTALTHLMGFGLQDAAHGRLVGWWMGRLVTRAAIFAALPVTCGLGSMYFSSGGEAYIRVGNAGALTDWEVINHEASDTG